MNDRYEEFKKYCNEIKGMEKLFKEFEEEQAEKEKENEIKNIITEIIARTPLKKVPKYKTSANMDLYCADVVTNKIYNALKEKDLIK